MHRPCLLLDPGESRLRKRALAGGNALGSEARQLGRLGPCVATIRLAFPRGLGADIELLHAGDEQTFLVAHLAQRFGHADTTHFTREGESRREGKGLMQSDGKNTFIAGAIDKSVEAVEFQLGIRQEPGLSQAAFRFFHGETRGDQFAVPHQRRLHRALHR